MNIFQRFFRDAESDVVKVLVAIKTGVEVIEEDIDKALEWVADNAPAIAAEIESVEVMIIKLGVVNNVQVAAAITAANAAVTALNAFAAAEKSGATKPQALVEGYIAVKQAQASAAAAAAAAAEQPAGAAI